MVAIQREAELRLAISTYRSLIASYTRARERMGVRPEKERAEIPLEERLAANARTIQCLEQAVAIASQQLDALVERSSS